MNDNLDDNLTCQSSACSSNNHVACDGTVICLIAHHGNDHACACACHSDTEVYVLIIADRHADVDVQVFRTEQAAREEMAAWRQGLIEWKGRDEWDERELSEEMIKHGWVAYVRYSPESDYVRIQRVTLQ